MNCRSFDTPTASSFLQYALLNSFDDFFNPMHDETNYSSQANLTPQADASHLSVAPASKPLHSFNLIIKSLAL
jgi:hypothetical protein